MSVERLFDPNEAGHGWILVRNWQRFQHYKDRRPPWIKLYDSIWDDEAFIELTPLARLVLIGIWQLYGRRNQKLSARPKYIQGMLSLPRSPRQQLLELVRAGFIEISDVAPQEAENPWASRYIPDQLRAELLREANNLCQECGTNAAQEIDHIVPISLGGTSQKSNLQALCRKCNRQKHNRNLSSTSLASVLTETETEEEQRAVRPTRDPAVDNGASNSPEVDLSDFQTPTLRSIP